MTAPGAIHPFVAAVAVAVLRGARTVREVAAAIGERSTSQTDAYLRTARMVGLVDWEARKTGTLRSTVEVVAHGTPID